MKNFTSFLMCIVISLSATSTALAQKSGPTTESEITKHLTQVATEQFLKNPDQLKLSASDKKDLNCMIENVFMEARGEDNHGKLLVANVVLNRVNHNDWPSTVCGVIHQPKQFSWTSNKKNSREFNDAKRRKTAAYRKAVWTSLYTMVFDGKPVTDATYFYAPAVVKNPPSWSRSKNIKLVEKHKNHYFYKESS